ncbi:protein of unknown function [Anaerocolumna jejuensis DSM 15929]|uniref:IrrE N-terminal-like domain-containing protein n=1 Tax=Anaerocolumna jejuensis DSM 15929 TaxID=1121322 RepID=A0A1M6MC81_9FIRM|nr:ImmA/IrrE family metallo-endopeptidase [Anaerocolumna jejuensis]SHJ80873.1 protein of unknown function [Anaerocolumna jejuensis DSM 15929]
MDWRRRKQITNLVDGILECNVLNQPPILLIKDIMIRRGIIFEERDEDDEEFCGIYMVMGNTKIIFVNANLYEPRKNFTIAHELGHHFLGHVLSEGAIVCDKSAFDTKNKKRPEQEKEADYFSSCFLMPKNLMNKKMKEFEGSYSEQICMIPIEKEEYNDALVEYLCTFFQVSKEAMRIRLEIVNC